MVPGGFGDQCLWRNVHSHDKAVRERGMSEETILMAVRIASVVHAIAGVLETESVAATLTRAAVLVRKASLRG